MRALAVCSVAHLLSILVRYDETLRAGSIAGAGPEERVDSIAVVVEAGQQECVFIHGVYVTRCLMVIGVKFANVFPPVWTVFRFLSCCYKQMKTNHTIGSKFIDLKALQ